MAEPVVPYSRVRPTPLIALALKVFRAHATNLSPIKEFTRGLALSVSYSLDSKYSASLAKNL